MAEQLSQADIDALLNTFTAEGEPVPGARTGRERASREIQADEYDFSHPDLLSRDQVRSLRTLHEGYAQALAKRLSTEFLTNVSASVVSIDHLTYTEFLMLLPTPTVLSVIDVPEMEGNIAIELNPNVAFAFIDRLLGGEGNPISKLRSLTAIEQGLMERVLQKCCQEMAGVWAPIHKLDFRLQAIEANPELARVVGPHEMIVLISMELRINEVSGMMNLCLPYVVMEPAIQQLSQGAMVMRKSKTAPVRMRSALEESLRSSKVQVDVNLGTAEVTLRELLELEIGDVLRFAPLTEEGAEALVEGSPKLAGSAGRSHGHLAFRVNRVLNGVERPNPKEG
ncbi:MAG: flagellar motor switch protein FliM [Gemmatimonadota bacterium]|nr:MAG: flagellar motor switch protein FliM [Gemmatimonadota bacterium]